MCRRRVHVESPRHVKWEDPVAATNLIGRMVVVVAAAGDYGRCQASQCADDYPVRCGSSHFFFNFFL
jgi:hypothetical protein